MTKKGSIPTGPSEQYLRLLKGEISPEEYAKAVEKRAQREPQRDRNGSTAAQRKRD